MFNKKAQGRPYKWAQTMCNLSFVNEQMDVDASEASKNVRAQEMHLIIQAIKDRIVSTKNLSQEIEYLSTYDSNE